jgi:hypothetical protein
MFAHGPPRNGTPHRYVSNDDDAPARAIILGVRREARLGGRCASCETALHNERSVVAQREGGRRSGHPFVNSSTAATPIVEMNPRSRSLLGRSRASDRSGSLCDDARTMCIAASARRVHQRPPLGNDKGKPRATGCAQSRGTPRVSLATESEGMNDVFTGE